ncbi:hypothetical protein ACFL5G_01785 [Candidatus Margulisiibacteriota bacterium]
MTSTSPVNMGQGSDWYTNKLSNTDAFERTLENNGVNDENLKMVAIWLNQFMNFNFADGANKAAINTFLKNVSKAATFEELKQALHGINKDIVSLKDGSSLKNISEAAIKDAIAGADADSSFAWKTDLPRLAKALKYYEGTGGNISDYFRSTSFKRVTVTDQSTKGAAVEEVENIAKRLDDAETELSTSESAFAGKYDAFLRSQLTLAGTTQRAPQNTEDLQQPGSVQNAPDITPPAGLSSVQSTMFDHMVAVAQSTKDNIQENLNKATTYYKQNKAELQKPDFIQKLINKKMIGVLGDIVMNQDKSTEEKVEKVKKELVEIVNIAKKYTEDLCKTGQLQVVLNLCSISDPKQTIPIIKSVQNMNIQKIKELMDDPDISDSDAKQRLNSWLAQQIITSAPKALKDILSSDLSAGLKREIAYNFMFHAPDVKAQLLSPLESQEQAQVLKLMLDHTNKEQTSKKLEILDKEYKELYKEYGQFLQMTPEKQKEALGTTDDQAVARYKNSLYARLQYLRGILAYKEDPDTLRIKLFSEFVPLGHPQAMIDILSATNIPESIKKEIALTFAYSPVALKIKAFSFLDTEKQAQALDLLLKHADTAAFEKILADQKAANIKALKRDIEVLEEIKDKPLTEINDYLGLTGTDNAFKSKKAVTDHIAQVKDQIDELEKAKPENAALIRITLFTSMYTTKTRNSLEMTKAGHTYTIKKVEDNGQFFFEYYKDGAKDPLTQEQDDALTETEKQYFDGLRFELSKIVLTKDPAIILREKTGKYKDEFLIDYYARILDKKDAQGIFFRELKDIAIGESTEAKKDTPEQQPAPDAEAKQAPSANPPAETSQTPTTSEPYALGDNKFILTVKEDGSFNLEIKDKDDKALKAIVIPSGELDLGLFSKTDWYNKLNSVQKQSLLTWLSTEGGLATKGEGIYLAGTSNEDMENTFDEPDQLTKK